MDLSQENLEKAQKVIDKIVKSSQSNKVNPTSFAYVLIDYLAQMASIQEDGHAAFCSFSTLFIEMFNERMKNKEAIS